MEILEAQKLRISRLGIQLEKVSGVRLKKGMNIESNIQNMPVNTYLFNKHLTGVIHLSYCKPDSLLSDCSDMEQFTF